MPPRRSTRLQKKKAPARKKPTQRRTRNPPRQGPSKAFIRHTINKTHNMKVSKDALDLIQEALVEYDLKFIDAVVQHTRSQKRKIIKPEHVLSTHEILQANM